MGCRTRTVRRYRVALETLESRLAPSVTPLVLDEPIILPEVAPEEVAVHAEPEIVVDQEFPVPAQPDLIIIQELGGETPQPETTPPGPGNASEAGPHTPAVEHVDRVFEDLGAAQSRRARLVIGDPTMPERETVLFAPRFLPGA